MFSHTPPASFRTEGAFSGTKARLRKAPCVMNLTHRRRTSGPARTPGREGDLPYFTYFQSQTFHHTPTGTGEYFTPLTCGP
jgi:hypothetical protein